MEQTTESKRLIKEIKKRIAHLKSYEAKFISESKRFGVIRIFTSNLRGHFTSIIIDIILDFCKAHNADLCFINGNIDVDFVKKAKRK